MSSNRAPRRHHYIPRMILRNFINDMGGLHFWRRSFAVGDVKVTTPENLFLEDDLYTFIGDEGERDVSLEYGFSKLESTGAQFLRQLLGIVRAGKTPRMGNEVWEFLHHFRYYSDKRSAAWHSRFLSDDEFNAALEEVANQPRWTDADRAWMTDLEDVDRIKRNARIAAQASGPPEGLLVEMRSRGLAVYLAPRNAAFVLGDHPTAMAKVGPAAEEAPGGKISFMPVASDVALGYCSQAKTVHVEQLTREQLRTMNEAMTRQSVMIAGRSHALIASLSRVNYETPDYFTTSEYLLG
ncbi:DUF4238 domain-containing protein [Devosia sp. SL43]|uniref:DUF4238 domain-containing protein n=1 Tax=Devosia sp. SL43 TaxID=2806348 RepID=UPI001F28A7EE|nr:DUF4238 domain-containing protein [Devosia sp. SL43]UJW86978.1 DUF4238 domain-containing protein [Devosia sp. SL43]